jgi:hypothetical protein
MPAKLGGGGIQPSAQKAAPARKIVALFCQI